MKSETTRFSAAVQTQEPQRGNTRKFDKLIQQIRDGIGQGHRDDYVPMWQVTRGNISHATAQLTGPMPGYQRGSHFCSPSHRAIALMFLWIGALDVREYFPLWPVDHPHPLDGWPENQHQYNSCPGLLSLFSSNSDAGKLRRQVGRGAVPTVTLMVTYGDPECPRCMLFDAIDSPTREWPPGANYSERYASANDMRHFAFGVDHIDRTLLRNVAACSSAVNSVRRDIDAALLPGIEEALTRELECNSYLDAVRSTSLRLNVDERKLWTVVHYMKWTQAIDVDLRYPIHHSERPRRGGSELRSALRQIILGDPS